MSEENKTVELNDEELANVSGGNDKNGRGCPIKASYMIRICEYSDEDRNDLSSRFPSIYPCSTCRKNPNNK